MDPGEDASKDFARGDWSVPRTTCPLFLLALKASVDMFRGLDAY